MATKVREAQAQRTADTQTQLTHAGVPLLGVNLKAEAPAPWSISPQSPIFVIRILLPDMPRILNLGMSMVEPGQSRKPRQLPLGKE